jgi:hypothetical protein
MTDSNKKLNAEVWPVAGTSLRYRDRGVSRSAKA